MISIKTGSLIGWLGFYWSIGLCQFYGIIYVCESTLMVTSDAIKNESQIPFLCFSTSVVPLTRSINGNHRSTAIYHYQIDPNIHFYGLEDLWKCFRSVLRLMKKFRGIFRRRFNVFQIVSYECNCISKNHLTHRWVYLDHLEQLGISLKTFETIPRNVPQKIPCFPECVRISLNTFPKDPRTHGGVYFDHLEQFGIIFRTIKEFRGMFCVFHIVSFYVKLRSNDPQT